MPCRTPTRCTLPLRRGRLRVADLGMQPGRSARGPVGAPPGRAAGGAGRPHLHGVRDLRQHWVGGALRVLAGLVLLCLPGDSRSFAYVVLVGLELTWWI